MLRPWKAALGVSSITSACANKDGMVGISIDTRAATASLPEAMDLLCLAVIVDGAVLEELVRIKCLKSACKKYPKEEHTSWAGVRGLCFSAQHQGLDVHAFATALERVFSTSAAPAGSPYSTARETLVEKVINRGLVQRLGEVATISCYVNSRDESTFGMWQNDHFYDRNMVLSPLIAVEDFFKQLTKLAKSIQAYQDAREKDARLRFEVSAIHLKLETCLPITSSVVNAVEEFMQAQAVGRVHCTEVKLDPRHISCTGDDLLRFVQAISRGSPGLSILTGFTPLSTLMQTVDVNGEDRSEMIRAMIHAIASCSCLNLVDLGPLLYLLGTDRNRQCMWRAVHEVLLAPSAPSEIGEFLIDSNTIITDEDAAYIKRLRGLRTRTRRQVRCLRLGSKDASDLAILAILALVRDMSELDIVVQMAEVSSTMVTTIIQEFPKLTSLRICGATIDSMAVFSDPGLRAEHPSPGSCLNKLDLFTPRILDRSTIPTFLSKLADPTEPIANTLHSLGFECPSGERGCELDIISATILKQVLETNRTLTYVEVMLDLNVPISLKKALESHRGDIVVKKGPIPEQEARKHAFLSVIRDKERGQLAGPLSLLDVTMIREIFAFAAPYEVRHVSAMYVDDGDEEATSEEEDGDE